MLILIVQVICPDLFEIQCWIRLLKIFSGHDLYSKISIGSF